MSTSYGRAGFSGALTARKIQNVFPPSLEWKAKQYLRKDWFRGLFRHGATAVANKLGVATFKAQLSAIHIDGKTGVRTDYGIVSRLLVTDAFAAFMVDELQAETAVWGDFKFHDSGVGTTAPNVTDTDMETTDGESRQAGTQIEGATAEIYKTVATITYTTTKAITEHGVFSIVTGGTLLDRDTFAAINVVNTDQIEFTYELTVTAGG